jgi:DNA-binding SARP family transcriptional activator
VLSLLKALVCLGVSRVRDRRLINAVWSGDEADAGKAAFNVTLHRLRKLLQHPEAISIQDGVVTLNTQTCWIDAIAYERLLDQPRSPERIERALALYRGNLLPEDDEEPWSTPLREKLQRKFLHEVMAIGDELESSQHWHRAIDLYQRALDADNLVEAFHRGLMRCYRALGRAPEAISAYQRMRRLFSVTLGIEPSAESETLYRSLLSMRLESADAMSKEGWRRSK